MLKSLKISFKMLKGAFIFKKRNAVIFPTIMSALMTIGWKQQYVEDASALNRQNYICALKEKGGSLFDYIQNEDEIVWAQTEAGQYLKNATSIEWAWWCSALDGDLDSAVVSKSLLDFGQRGYIGCWVSEEQLELCEEAKNRIINGCRKTGACT